MYRISRHVADFSVARSHIGDQLSYAIAVGPALVVGFVAGLLAFRQKSRWCPTCGATFTCPDRTRHTEQP
jgi:NADH pyrophosphatase NudC (nudix superfamily)